MMKALHVTRNGEPVDVLELVDAPQPDPGPGQVGVRVLATPANFPDVLMCRGQYQVRPDLPFTPGIELCGEVIALGEGITSLELGDRVVGQAVLPFGGFAEFALMDMSTTFAAPTKLGNAEASTLFVGYQTAWFGLHRRGHLKVGETLLVHAAAGGVGSAAVQLGKAAGAQVIAVVGGPEKANTARQLGADVVVDHWDEDFVEIVREATRGHGADVVFDPVGGATYMKSTKCIAFEGRIIVVGFAAGEISSAALNHPLMKNYSILGLHWNLYNRHDPAAVRSCHESLCDLAGAGAIQPLVSVRTALSDAPSAIQDLADGTTVGRVVYDSGLDR